MVLSRNNGQLYRANLNVRIRPGFEYKVVSVGITTPNPQNVQGVLALANQTDENMGCFQCLPWLYRNYDTWRLGQPTDTEHFKHDVTGLELVEVKMEAGDLLNFNNFWFCLIWIEPSKSALPAGRIVEGLVILKQ